LILVFLVACGHDPDPLDPPATNSGPDRLTLSSRSITPNQPIPIQYTCDGESVSPDLAWAGAPSDTVAYALVVDDVDAGPFTHWLAWNIPSDAVELAARTAPTAIGGVEGTNDVGLVGDAGPCPPTGELHHYRFQVLALDEALDLDAGADRAAFDDASAPHAIAGDSFLATYER
jgi:hypothetical protein